LNRVEFLRRLGDVLGAMPAEARAQVLADYESYFAEGQAAGRDESDIAESLGDPRRIAAELRLGHDLGEWRRGARGRPALRALSALATLVLFEGVAWLPLLLGLLAVLLLGAASIAALAYGCATLFIGFFDAPLGGLAAAGLRALAYLSAGVGMLLLCNMAVYGLGRGFIRLTRIHRRVLRHSTEVSP
jgi:uncharacterized membrane protein